MRQLLLKLPIPVAGLALGLVSVAKAVTSRWPLPSVYLDAAMWISGGLLLTLLARCALEGRQLKHTLQQVPVASVLPTSCMALWQLNSALADISPSLAWLVWWAVLLLHTALCLNFFKVMQAHGWHQLLPTAFIPPIGVLVASLCLPQPAASAMVLCQGLWLFALLSYGVLLPRLCLRLRRAPLSYALQPLQGVFAAPASLLLTSGFALFELPTLFIIGLQLIAFGATGWVYSQLPRWLSGSFRPSQAALTFPLVISSLASHATAVHMQQAWLEWLSTGQLALAIAVVLLVFCRFLLAFGGALHQHLRLQPLLQL